MESLSDDKLRESLLKSIDTSLSCAEVMKARVSHLLSQKWVHEMTPNRMV
jgi:hypothetical protein